MATGLAKGMLQHELQNQRTARESRLKRIERMVQELEGENSALAVDEERIKDLQEALEKLDA